MTRGRAGNCTRRWCMDPGAKPGSRERECHQTGVSHAEEGQRERMQVVGIRALFDGAPCRIRTCDLRIRRTEKSKHSSSRADRVFSRTTEVWGESVTGLSWRPIALACREFSPRIPPSASSHPPDRPTQVTLHRQQCSSRPLIPPKSVQAIFPVVRCVARRALGHPDLTISVDAQINTVVCC